MRWARLCTAIAATLLIAACGSSAGGSAGGGTLRVVASTNVYGDIARHIGGDRVSVTSIISDPDQDPHSYEANARTQLALSKADLVIENGGGYDDFVDRMLSSAGTSPTLINVVKLSGSRTNEHVWYDFAAVRTLVRVIAKDLSAKDAGGAGAYAANAARFTTQLDKLISTEQAIRSKHAGAGVAITEPVPLYLLQACGLVNKTPAAFSEAIEEGDDVPVRVLDDTLALFTDKKVALLAYNEQTSGPETEKVLAAAKDAGVAVVPVTETLPADEDYLSWMSANLAAVQKALG